MDQWKEMFEAVIKSAGSDYSCEHLDLFRKVMGQVHEALPGLEPPNVAPGMEFESILSVWNTENYYYDIEIWHNGDVEGPQPFG